MASDETGEQMLGNSFCYNQADISRVSLRTWVNVVYGYMTNIDRKKKLVAVDNNTEVPYDHLILCTGEQYQVPAPTEADVTSGMIVRKSEPIRFSISFDPLLTYSIFKFGTGQYLWRSWA